MTDIVSGGALNSTNSTQLNYQLMPPVNSTGYNLQKRSRNLTLPLIDNNMLKKTYG